MIPPLPRPPARDAARSLLLALVVGAPALPARAAAQPEAPAADAPALASARPLEPARDLAAASPAQSAPSSAATGLGAWSFGGYGEMLLSTRFFHPDPKKTTSYRQTDVDIARLAFFVNAPIADWISFTSELEIEHGGTGSSKEVEWEEFGEYEVELEKGGEIELEQATLEARISRNLTVRVGHLLVPVGMTTSYHLPDMFASVHRPESEAHLIPLVWHETGAELALRFGDLGTRLLVVSGLDSTGFSSAQWVAGGTQRMFEGSLFNSPAIALAVDYTGIPRTLLGVSGYTSDTTRNRPKREMDDVSARVFIGDVHLRGQYGPFRLRAMAMAGSLRNAEAITAANASLSNALGVPRTPVGSGAYALFAEGVVDVLRPLGVVSRQRLDVFARYDVYDSMWKAPAVLDNPLLQRRVLTTGLNYLPHPRVVLKAELLSRWINQGNDWGLRQSEINGSVGFTL